MSELEESTGAVTIPGIKALVVIPTYNEVRNITSAIGHVMALPIPVDVLVIDDASPDGTAARVRELQDQYPGRIHLLERSGKLGLGTAYVMGFRWGLEAGYEVLCEMDADLSHNPRDLPRLIAPIAEGKADMVVGSRYVGGVRVINWPLPRLVISYGAGIYTRVITRMPVMDATSGFKCFHRRVLEGIDFKRIRSNGYSFQMEMNYRAWRKGFKILEVPIVFTERSEGQSKMSKAIMVEAAVKVWELRLRAIIGRL